ncbi:MAG: hypothetical protein ACKPEY_07650, partial [Planctomycetota bacterium]
MPKLLSRLPSYRRHSLRNTAFVVISGKRTYLPGEFNSEESRTAYRRLVAEWVVTDRPTAPVPSVNDITIVEVMVQFQ